VARLLLEKGADIEAEDLDGRTALLEAAGNGQETLVRLLLEKDASVEAKDRRKRTALFKAAGAGSEAAVRLLLEKGARAEVEDEYGWTAQRMADWEEHIVIVGILETWADSGSLLVETVAFWGTYSGKRRPPGNLLLETVAIVLISFRILDPLCCQLFCNKPL
jgi:hypothetical protein